MLSLSIWAIPLCWGHAWWWENHARAFIYLATGEIGPSSAARSFDQRASNCYIGSFAAESIFKHLIFSTHTTHNFVYRMFGLVKLTFYQTGTIWHTHKIMKILGRGSIFWLNAYTIIFPVRFQQKSQPIGRYFPKIMILLWMLRMIFQ